MKFSKDFKIRASACGQIMGARGLGKTGETYIKEWLLSKIFNRQKNIKSKYLDKGVMMEDEAIEFASKMLYDNALVFKNTKYYEDEFMCGTPDLINDNTVIDIKCSWDCFTFPLLDKEIKNKDYFYQLQVYMHLTGLKKAKLVYCLMNTPESLIYENEDYHNYDDIEDKNKIKVFDIDYDKKVIDKIIERVKECKKIIEDEEKNRDTTY